MADVRQLQDRLSNGEIVVLDGAIGTEIERLGAPMDHDLWCAMALETHPQIVTEVHENFINAGADVITTNTFSSTRHAMEHAGNADRFEEWNVKATELAVEARDRLAGDRPIYIAGSVAHYGVWSEDFDMDRVTDNHRQQAKILADNGAELILLEMLGADADESARAVEAVSEAGLPVWVALSCMMRGEGGTVMLGSQESWEGDSYNIQEYKDFGSAIETIMGAGGSALLVMHSYIKTTVPALEVMKQHYDGPLGAYPNAGYWQRPNWTFTDQLKPEEFVSHAQEWVGAGAQIIGGCCGIGVDPIKAYADSHAAHVS